MERKIGEIFEFGGEWYQCVIVGDCRDCAFNNDNCEERKRITLKNKLTKEEVTGLCTSELRSDGKSVIFKKLEKVGESYMNNEKIVQKYKIYHDPLIAKDGVVERYVPGLIDIVIKQTKEDMEEKKTNFVEEIDALCKRYNMSDGARTDFMSELKEIIKDKEKCNLKPFDLEKAKDGKPVCTRDGHKARILCYDLKGAEYPIVAAVETRDRFAESIFGYDKNGRFDHDTENNNDLMMLSEKKEGWVNVYTNEKVKNSRYCSTIYSSKEEAMNNISLALGHYISTDKTEWEE